MGPLRTLISLCLAGALLTACGPGQASKQAQPAQPAASAAPPWTAPSGQDQRGAILKKEHKGTVGVEEINAVANKFLVGGALPARYGVDWYRVELQSTDRDEKPLKVVAQLFVPKSDQASTFPLYVFGPGTTGLNDQCAPPNEQPNERSWGDFHSHLLTYAGQGYIAVMPDYEGFNDGPRLHHYYVGDQQARVMLDATRAALRFFDSASAGQPSATKQPAQKQNPVFVAGYSHGGYVAFATRDLAPKYAPELKLMGVVGYGPRSEVSTLFKDMPSLGPYVLYSYANYYGADKVPIDKLIQPRLLPTLERDVTTKCIDEVVGYYGDDPAAIYSPEFLGALKQGTLGQQFPALKQIFDQNKAGLSTSAKNVPVLVLHGTNDTVVAPETLRTYMQELCSAGGKGQYVAYPNLPHTLIRQTGYQDTIRWMEAVRSGQFPKNDCA
ncbi:MAG TPA: alpha/beta fold hydrolase [Chloroflexota bacterium]|nr:alpha/beta fold hydrolase [Chloroflexota bacterium]